MEYMTLLREIFSKQMLSERKIIMPIITAKVPVNVIASVLAYLESGYRRN
jgi:hypothetical protein